jgi:hypothetical protein
LFYLIRISFSIFLIFSIVLLSIAIGVIVIGGVVSTGSGRTGNRRNSGNQDDEDDLEDLMRTSGNFLAGWGFSPDFLWYLWPTHRHPAVSHRPGQQINFLEAIFSFVFGDGNPNANLAAQGWQQLGALIRQNRGAVVAEQIAPYLISPPNPLTLSTTNENYVLPALVQFNGVPQVSEAGDIIYQFPDLQTTAGSATNSVANASTRQPSLLPALDEKLWQFSRASQTQVFGAMGLGLLNLIAALVLRALWSEASVDGFIGFVRSIFWLLLTYGTGFLGIPCFRYLLLLDRNQKIGERNYQRQQLVTQLQTQSPELERKLAFARQFAQQNILDTQDLAYTTETDLLQQEIEQKDKHDAEWQQRLDQS